nr:unnamed protein product [Callosobruchus analis]
MVRKWVKAFKDGRTNVHVEERSGRPSVVNEDLVQKVDEKQRVPTKQTREIAPVAPARRRGEGREAPKEKPEYREWQRNPNNESHRSFTDARNRCKHVIDSSKEEHNQKIKNKLLSCLSSSRTFWSVAKAVSQNFSYSSIPPLTREDRSIASTPKGKADILGKLFADNSTVDFQGNPPATTFNVNSRMAEVKFQHRDVRNVLQNLNTNKASGPDQIPAIVLKRCAVEITPILCKLFKVSYEQGVFPATWKIACVQPIPKKGKKPTPTITDL